MTLHLVRHVEHVMGTAVVFDLPKGETNNGLANAVEFLHWVDATFSVYRPDSDISRVARGDILLDDAIPEVRQVLSTCDALRAATGGWFDHRPESGHRRLDPSGYVKGWSVDEAALILRVAGVTDFCISAGGDVRSMGGPANGRPWQIGVRHPAAPERSVATISLRDGAVATSGRYERGDHIWPKAQPEKELLSATCVGPELGTADALATAVLAADRAFDLSEQYPGYRLLTVDRSLQVARYGWPVPAARS